MSNVNVDHVLLNILMWDRSQKLCFLLALFLLLIEVRTSSTPSSFLH